MAEEYIEKLFAIEAIKSLYPDMPRIDFCGSLRKWHEDNKNFMQCEMAIDVIPAADVAPVRHGKWINQRADSEMCSACGTRFYISALFAVGGNDEPLYCPNCGAFMDKGVSDV